MDKWDFVPHYLLFCLVANMSQIRDKKAHKNRNHEPHKRKKRATQ